MMVFKDSIEEDRKIFDKWLIKEIETIKESDVPEIIVDAMEYSLRAGGKRLRPILMMESYKLFKGDIEIIRPKALAIEFIHTYSLIHDDLPAMDNDDFRRGKLTNHKVYGEGMAILAGDALLNYSMELLIENISSDKDLESSKLISKASGVFGMIGGQVIDIQSEGKTIDIKTLERLHEKKTGKLIEASILTGAILGGASNIEYENLKKYAKGIGLAFQITDDILDVEGDQEELGKLTGSDIENKKVTYTTIFGVEESKKIAKEVIDEAILSINDISQNNFFIEFGKYILDRKS